MRGMGCCCSSQNAVKDEDRSAGSTLGSCVSGGEPKFGSDPNNLFRVLSLDGLSPDGDAQSLHAVTLLHNCPELDTILTCLPDPSRDGKNHGQSTMGRSMGMARPLLVLENTSTLLSEPPLALESASSHPRPLPPAGPRG